MKKLICFSIWFMLSGFAFAGQKVTEMTEDTSPTVDDLIMTVNDPVGTPASRKMAIQELFNLLFESSNTFSARLVFQSTVSVGRNGGVAGQITIINSDGSTCVMTQTSLICDNDFTIRVPITRLINIESGAGNQEIQIGDNLVIVNATDISFAAGRVIISSFTNLITLRSTVTVSGVIVATGTTPTIGSCGTSPSVNGTDMAGQMTVGTGGVATSCAMTFAHTWKKPPACISNHEGAILVTRSVATTTTLTIDAATPLTASGKLDYICIGID